MTEADLDQPATKRFVRDAVDELAQATARGFEQTATKADLAALRQEVKQDMKSLKQEVRQDMKTLKDEIVFEFKAAIEIIEDRLAGANKDEISGLKDADQRLADRVTVLERHAGLPAE